MSELLRSVPKVGQTGPEKWDIRTENRDTSAAGHAGTLPPSGGSVPSAVSRVSHVPCPMSHVPPEGEAKPGRALMPMTAEWVDWLRQALGREVVDAAIASGQQMRRQHALMVAKVGQATADNWLRLQRPKAGSFWAREGGNEVGVRR